MPSFDVVSEVDMHEVHNAVDQANREVGTRFDFKGSGSEFKLDESKDESKIDLEASSEFQLEQMMDILRAKLTKRGIDITCMDEGKASMVGRIAHQTVTLQQGIEQPLAKDIIKRIKEGKFKVQASVQGDKVRITGKKRDDLQEVIVMLRAAELDMPLQFDNFRD